MEAIEIKTAKAVSKHTNDSAAGAPPSMLSAIVSNKCPRCRRGKLYLHSWYNVNKFLVMPERCSHCGFKYEIEPGFFWGAMYISYGLVVAIFIAGMVGYFVSIERPQVGDLIPFALSFIAIVVVTLPLLSRLSRSVLLHLFASVKFRKDIYDAPPEQAKTMARQQEDS